MTTDNARSMFAREMAKYVLEPFMDSVVADIYDQNDDIALAMSHLMEYEYPDVSGMTVREFVEKSEKHGF